MAHYELTRKQKWTAAFCLSLALTILHPLDARAQAKGTISQNPVNPLGVPNPNYRIPVRNIIVSPVNVPRANAQAKNVQAPPTPTPTPTPCPAEVAPSEPPKWTDWTFTLSESYQFLNDRSRTGGLSLNSDSAITDVAAVLNRWPWTYLDLSYMYSYLSGTSPSRISQTGSQNVGSFTLLQPWYPFRQKKPAPFTTDTCNDQFAIILSADYGDSWTSTTIPQSASIRGRARAFLGNALLDWQHAWFPNRGRFPNRANCATYPGWLFDLTSGVQFDTIRLRSSNSFSSETSFGDQATYRNIGSVTYLFPCKLGILVAAEWDAPLHSEPLRGSEPFYANTAVFTGGLVYNIFASRIPPDPHGPTDLLSPWSASLLYSYTAFNPFSETNQLQIQISYSF